MSRSIASDSVATTRRSGHSASRKCGRSRGPSTASSTPWAGLCAPPRSTASSAARSSTRGKDMLTLGMVVGLDYRDVELSVHDLLQELKTHPFVRRLLEGGERIEWGAKTIPEGGFLALPKHLHAPGLLICGDGAGLVNVPALKGIHYAVESGRLAAETAFSALQRGESPWRRGARSG